MEREIGGDEFISTLNPDIMVIAKAKHLSALVFEVTERSPKRFRFTLVGRMQNLSLDIISNIYRANDTFIDVKAIKEERVSKRLDFSYAALTAVKELDHLVTLSKEMGCILPKQQERIAEQIFNVRNLLGAFIKSDKARYNY